MAIMAAAVALASASVTTRDAAAQEPVDPCAAPQCEITLTKQLMSGSPVAVGGSVIFKVVVTNTGELDIGNVALVDIYDQGALDFISSSTAPAGIEEGAGVLFWNNLLPDPDGGSAAVWEAGESRSVTVTFRALQAASSENCVLAAADLVVQGSEDEPPTGPETGFVCARVVITSPEPSSGRRPAATPTTRPGATPTAVSTVAGATRVPAAATPRTGVVIASPDTGTGDGLAGGGMSTMALLGLAAAAVSATAGLVLIRKAKD